MGCLRGGSASLVSLSTTPPHSLNEYALKLVSITITHLIKFLLRIRGALTAAPTKDDPVNQMPQAAPTTLKPNPKATPKLAHPYGDMWVRTSDHPALQNSDVHVVEESAMVDFAVVADVCCDATGSKRAKLTQCTKVILFGLEYIHLIHVFGSE